MLTTGDSNFHSGPTVRVRARGNQVCLTVGSVGLKLILLLSSQNT